MNLGKKHHASGVHDEDQWISLSDIMTSMMMIFLLISVSYMLKMERLANIIKDTKQDIYQELKQSLGNDLHKWGAELSPDLTIAFQDPDTLFDSGSAELKEKYKSNLNEFFPKYLKTIMQDNIRSKIKEVRIEGHTSSHWKWDTPANEAYFLNMALSQERTRDTLDYVMNNTGLTEIEKEWLQKKFRAIGFSSAAPRDKHGNPADSPETEDPLMSQRVEFKLLTNTEDLINQAANDGQVGL